MEIFKKIVKKIFRWEARTVLRKYKPKIIAIIGSVGKTGSREALYLLLSKKFFVRRNQKSFTAELGVPLSVIGCPSAEKMSDWIRNILLGLSLLIRRRPYPEWLIIEIDGDKRGDLRSARWLRPDILVLTAIGEVPSHIESFSSIEEFLAEKKILIDSLPRESRIIYNADDQVVRDLAENSLNDRVAVGMGENTDVQGSDFSILYSHASNGSVPTGMTFEISSKNKDGQGGEKHIVTMLGSIGISSEYTALIGVAVAGMVGFSTTEAVEAFSRYIPPPGRMNLISGVNNSTIVDDSYNASPIAVAQALEVFSRIEASRKIVVLGDMLELGRFSAEEHRKVAHRVKADVVVCVGLRARRIAEELREIGFAGEVICRDNASAAAETVKEILQTADLVLVKGSQAIRLERVVEAIMRHPEDSKNLLVRQEKEWLERE